MKLLKTHPFLLPMKTTQTALRNLHFRPELLPTYLTPRSQDHLQFEKTEEFKAEQKELRSFCSLNHYQILFPQRSASWKEKQPHIWNLRDGSAFLQQHKCLIYHLTRQFFRLPESSFQLLLVFRIGELSISFLRLWKQSMYIKETERYQSTTGKKKKTSLQLDL